MNLYFDNGATSFPKPPRVSEAVSRYLDEIGGPYGRSFYKRSLTVSSELEEARDLTADFLGAENAENLIFCHNATTAINTVIKGLELSGRLNKAEVLVSPLEHNAVMRPLNASAARCGSSVKVIPAHSDGLVDISALKSMISGRTALVIICHQSNVSGLIQPLEEIKQACGEIPLMADASQSAGHSELLADAWGIDFTAFTGHKGLLGPTGTGGLYMRDHSLLQPLVDGGTGSRSEETVTPEFMPDRFEGGTPNIAGIFGLKAAIENRPEPAHSRDDYIGLLDAVGAIEGIKLVRAASNEHQGEVFSVLSDRFSCSEFGSMLYEDFGIETRLGLHCAPAAHGFYGTFPSGTVRISPSVYHKAEEFDFLISAVRSVQNR